MKNIFLCLRYVSFQMREVEWIVEENKGANDFFYSSVDLPPHKQTFVVRQKGSNRIEFSQPLFYKYQISSMFHIKP